MQVKKLDGTSWHCMLSDVCPYVCPMNSYCSHEMCDIHPLSLSATNSSAGAWTECWKRRPVLHSAFQYILSWDFLESSEESLQHSPSRHLSVSTPRIRLHRMQDVGRDHSPRLVEALDRTKAEAMNVKAAQNVANKFRSATSTAV